MSWRLIGKIDQHAFGRLAAGLAHEPEHRMGDAALGLFGRNLAQARVRVLQPASDCLQRIGGESAGCRAISPAQAADGQMSARLSMTAVAVPG